MAVSPVWRRRSVYVTSTFRDMRAEREHLHTSVLPELEERLRRRRQQVEPIDLRWEVEVGSAEDEQATDLLTLEVCLAEIHRSRPLQIVLIGDRYGWIPPPERAQAAVEEAGLQTDAAGKSVIGLEIEFGLHGTPDRPRQCFFYFREPLPYDRMADEVAADYRDPDHAPRLAELKQRIEEEVPDRVRRYRAEWDDQKQAVTGLDDWGQMVLDDLWRVLDGETRGMADLPPPGWQDEERAALENFIEARGRRFVGRARITGQLCALAHSPAETGKPWGACVTGISGAGKSALFAHLHDELQQDDLLLLSHAAGVSVCAAQVDAMLRRWTTELAEALRIAPPVGDGSMSRSVERSFAGLLARASADRRVVLLIDGLDQFEATPRARQLQWLPARWPENARLIATTAPGVWSEALEERPGVEPVALPPLDEDEARRITEVVCGEYHRRLQPEVLEALLSKRLPEGSPAAGVPLWLVLATEELNLLDTDECVGAAGDPSSTVGQRTGASILEAARELPPDAESLCQWRLDRAEERFGIGLAGGFANLVALSRSGLRELDLQVLVPKVTKLLAPSASRQSWNGLKFALLRRAFRGHLMQREADGRWDFAHASMRRTIQRRNLRDPQVVQGLHGAIAYHLKSLQSSDPVRQTELMVHLIGSEDRLRAAHYYSGDLPEEELTGATRALAAHILAGSSQTPNAGLGWTASLLIEPKLDRCQVGMLCRRYNVELLGALGSNAPVDARRRLADAARQAAEELAEQDPENALWQQDLVASYRNLATFYEEANNPTEAKACWRRCHETLRALRDADVSLDPPLAELLDQLEQRLEALR